MDYKQAVIDVRAGGAGAVRAEKPLMLQTMLFCPVIRWVCQELLPCGVERFFLVCDEERRDETAGVLKELDAQMSFYDTPAQALAAAGSDVIVVPDAVVPVWGEEPRTVYAADAALLLARLADGVSLCDCPAEAVGIRTLWRSPSPAPSFRPVADAAELQAAMPAARELLMRRMAANGVTVIDPCHTYVDPRCAVAPGVTLLPGTILRGTTSIGRNCEIGPNTMIRDCAVGDRTEVNASQCNESVIGSDTHVGPFAYIRPHCTVGDHIKVGDFVELKNSSIGDGTKISHLTYVGDSDVGQKVNFGCGTITTNYDGFRKFRCDIGDGAFIGCNTNLVAPVKIGAGAYTAAGSTVTRDVPADALHIARPEETIKEGWAKRRRQAHGKD